MSKQAINVNVNVGYWFQGSGLTGQNLSEHNQNKWSRLEIKYKRKMGKKLSKTRCYIASRVAARKIKAEYGTRILSNSITTFELLMTAIDRTLDRKNHNIDLGEFHVVDIADLACAPTGAAAHRKSA